MPHPACARARAQRTHARVKADETARREVIQHQRGLRAAANRAAARGAEGAYAIVARLSGGRLARAETTGGGDDGPYDARGRLVRAETGGDDAPSINA